MRQVVLSIDYEIFGNGAGDVRQHMVEPMRRMAQIAEKYDVPLTIFVEAEELAAFDRFASILRKKLGYDPAAEIRTQVKSLAGVGHDIQLHLHPEWVGAEHKDGKWVLRSGTNAVDQLFDSQSETDRHIADRKTMVEDAAGAKPVRVYRAGAFTARPGSKLLKALATSGIVIDSSVVKGLYHRNGSVDLDYRLAPCAKGPWPVYDDVIVPRAGGPIWEFPIYSVMGRRYQQVTPRRLRAKFSRTVPVEQKRRVVSNFGSGKSLFSFTRFLTEKVPIKLDFHNIGSAKLLRWIQAAPPPADSVPDVVVLIGHSKEHHDDKEFEKLVRGIARNSGLKGTGFGAVAEQVSRGAGRGGFTAILENGSINAPQSPSVSIL